MQDEEDFEEDAAGSEDEEFEDRDDDDDHMDVSPTQSQTATRTNFIRPTCMLRLPPHISELRQLGDEATWTLSSAKAGNGAEALRNGETQTYWQSDGTHPHTITVQFHRRAALLEVAMYCALRLDESYTPKRIRVMAGTTVRDLDVVVDVELENPEGWVLISLADPITQRPLRTFTLQIQCLSMHQNGRDTHIRAIKLFGPRSTVSDDNAGSKPLNSKAPSSRASRHSSSQLLFNFEHIR